MTPSNPSCTTPTRELSKRARQSSVTLAVLSSKRKEESDGLIVIAPPQGWDEKDERWKRAKPILALPHVLRCSGRQWFCEVCDKRASGGAAKIKTGAHRMYWASCDSTGTARKTTKSPPGSDWQLRVVLQMQSESSQVREETWRTVCWASEVSGVRTKHPPAVERVAHQGKIEFLGSPKLYTAQAWMKWRQSY